MGIHGNASIDISILQSTSYSTAYIASDFSPIEHYLFTKKKKRHSVHLWILVFFPEYHSSAENNMCTRP